MNNKKTMKIKLYDYNTYDDINKIFIIQMFGIDETGKSASIFVEGFHPFFYILVNDTWNDAKMNCFISYIKKRIGKIYENYICEYKLKKKYKLYGFNNKKEYTFIKIKFTNIFTYNKVKNLFYKDTNINDVFERNLSDNGLIFEDTNCYLYEADIPPLLKFFHIKNISPTGWINIDIYKKKIEKINKKTDCSYEYLIMYENIKPLKNIETSVKYIICSFDIEASSSHGDFPVAIKNYKKLANQILEHYYSLDENNKENYNETLLRKEIKTAFKFDNLYYISHVYPKKYINNQDLDILINKLLLYKPGCLNKYKEEYIELSDTDENDTDIEDDLNNTNDIMENNDQETIIKYKNKVKKIKSYTNKNATILDVIKDNNCEYETKLNELIKAFPINNFPELKGDEITFIGLTFMNYTEKEPYKRILIVNGDCEPPDKYIEWKNNNKVEIYDKLNETEILLKFKNIILTENPHIITGYNITGFDFEFMFKRAKELNCYDEFLKLSRNKNEICKNTNFRTKEEDIETNKIILASGEYNLKFIKMTGRIIIDMCVVFRKEYSLSSYKLDYTSSYFISDIIKKCEINEENNTTKIYSKNLTGLSIGSYIKFEEIGFSNNIYKKGKKFEIIDIDKENGIFIINSSEKLDLEKYKYNWGLAKDDVTPQQIFELTKNGNKYDRWTIGKYCLADCDNVIWLLLKTDIITDKIEMSNLCDVPLSYLLLRGQGIKLQSFVSKKCREKNTLMPVIKKKKDNAGYEGAHVFTPKTGIYLEEPVACVDYSSLYPSSIISENLSHDSKVWTKEYNLENNLIKEEGEKDENGNYLYDNLNGYTYVDVKYDTYKYVRKTIKAAAKKEIIGYKICRFAQFPDSKAIMPSILEELLAARKATRKLIPLQTDEFMKNILDKRQLSIKVTANSLYGQMGAVTSAFYEQDVAASTTAIGRKLLFYARSVIENCYNNIEIKMKDEKLLNVKAECVYGDTDSVFFKFNLIDNHTKMKIINKEALIYTIELAKQAGNLATRFLKKPHDLEYEKTFYPFVLLSKKRYVGMLYEDDPNKCKMKFMGIVLKRRDNAAIVKDIYGGVVNILMQERSLNKSIKFVHECLENLISEKYPIEKLIITKALRGYYKNPKQIAHKVLAERIGLRDFGNKPSTGDRINYAFIKNNNLKALQGEKIETIDFIKSNNLKIDYSYYISNQIMKPLLQLFALELENIKEFQNKYGKTLQAWKTEIDKLKIKWNEPEKYEKKLEEFKCKEIKQIIFDKYLNKK